MSKRLLWCGDAGVATGFAKATHHVLDTVCHDYEVGVLGLNFNGDPTAAVQYPYPIWPAIYQHTQDYFGLRGLETLTRDLQPDVVVIQNDVWNIPEYVKAIKLSHVPTKLVGFLAVDGLNCQGWKLNDLDLAIFWTEFAQREAVLGGMTIPSLVIPLGVDLDTYRPCDQRALRRTMKVTGDVKVQGLTDESFIVLNVNRNQQRKRLDLSVQYFCDWVQAYDVDDAYLMLHACPTGEDEYDVEQLMEYRGLRSRLLHFRPDIGRGIPESQLVLLYANADIGITTTQGEGFGLTTFEMMAMQKAMIVPQWAALGELCGDAAIQVPCTSQAVTQRRVNVIGGVADRTQFVKALHDLYTHSSLRELMGMRARALVEQPRYRWNAIGHQFLDALTTLWSVTEPVEVSVAR